MKQYVLLKPNQHWAWRRLKKCQSCHDMYADKDLTNARGQCRSCRTVAQIARFMIQYWSKPDADRRAWYDEAP